MNIYVYFWLSDIFHTELWRLVFCSTAVAAVVTDVHTSPILGKLNFHKQTKMSARSQRTAWKYLDSITLDHILHRNQSINCDTTSMLPIKSAMRRHLKTKRLYLMLILLKNVNIVAKIRMLIYLYVFFSFLLNINNKCWYLDFATSSFHWIGSHQQTAAGIPAGQDWLVCSL